MCIFVSSRVDAPSVVINRQEQLDTGFVHGKSKYQLNFSYFCIQMKFNKVFNTCMCFYTSSLPVSNFSCNFFSMNLWKVHYSCIQRPLLQFEQEQLHKFQGFKRNFRLKILQSYEEDQAIFRHLYRIQNELKTASYLGTNAVYAYLKESNIDKPCVCAST